MIHTRYVCRRLVLLTNSECGQSCGTIPVIDIGGLSLFLNIWPSGCEIKCSSPERDSSGPLFNKHIGKPRPRDDSFKPNVISAFETRLTDFYLAHFPELAACRELWSGINAAIHPSSSFVPGYWLTARSLYSPR